MAHADPALHQHWVAEVQHLLVDIANQERQDFAVLSVYGQSGSLLHTRSFLELTSVQMMVGLVLTNLEPIIVLLAQCNPPSKYWRPSTPGKCWPTKVRIYSIYVQVGKR
jgi:hypothetical protein